MHSNLSPVPVLKLTLFFFSIVIFLAQDLFVQGDIRVENFSKNTALPAQGNEFKMYKLTRVNFLRRHSVYICRHIVNVR